MSKPKIGGTDAATGISWLREMTDEEYEALLASGWTEEGNADTVSGDTDT
jgi:hypothetical protein